MEDHYLLVAGPQAAGKSSLIEILRQRRDIQVLQEARQIILQKNKRAGGIRMTRSDEIEVIHHDMQRMFGILGDCPEGRVYVDETNIFTLGHAMAHGINLVDGFFKQYCDMLKQLNAVVLFIDVRPEISWMRRRPRYEQRLADLPVAEFDATMRCHHEYLEKLYPELLKLYRRLDLPKTCIDGSGPAERTTMAALRAIHQLSISC